MHFVMNSESSDPWNCTDIISQPTFTHKSKVDYPGRALNHLPRETSFSCRVDAFAAPSCSTAGADAEAAKRQLRGKAQNSEIAALEGGIELGSTASHSSDLQDRSRRNTVRPKRERYLQACHSWRTISYISANKYGTEDLWKRPIGMCKSMLQFFYYYKNLDFFFPPERRLRKKRSQKYNTSV